MLYIFIVLKTPAKLFRAILYGALVAVWQSAGYAIGGVTGSNLGLGYIAPRSTQPSISGVGK